MPVTKSTSTHPSTPCKRLLPTRQTVRSWLQALACPVYPSFKQALHSNARLDEYRQGFGTAFGGHLQLVRQNLDLFLGSTLLNPLTMELCLCCCRSRHLTATFALAQLFLQCLFLLIVERDSICLMLWLAFKLCKPAYSTLSTVANHTRSSG